MINFGQTIGNAYAAQARKASQAENEPKKTVAHFVLPARAVDSEAGKTIGRKLILVNGSLN
jgi:hypothetical protein